MNKVIAVIPARGGSKRVPGKNVKLFGGYPLLAYAIAAARLARTVERTIVSTDAPDIAALARTYGAETPFLRPAEFATDSSGDIDFVRHLLDWLRDHEGGEPEYLVHLRPTTPLRDPELIDRAVGDLTARPEATALRSVHPLRESPYKQFIIEHGYLAGMFPHDPRPEYYNLPNQVFPPAYQPDGLVDVLKTDTVRRLGVLHGTKMLGFVVPDPGEIDTPEDFAYVEHLRTQRGSVLRDWLQQNFAPEAQS